MEMPSVNLLKAQINIIPLTKGKFTIIDAEDYDKVGKWKWCINTNGGAVRTRKVNSKSKGIQMSRFILNLTNPKLVVDHINGNRLDNRKENLRICTQQQNIWNTRKRSDNTSGYKGVHFDDVKWRNKKWRAQISYNKKLIFIGRFETAEQAKQAYQLKAKELFGEFVNYG